MRALRSVSCLMVTKYLGLSRQLMTMEMLDCFLQYLFAVLIYNFKCGRRTSNNLSKAG